MAAFSSVQNGNWSSASVWASGSVTNVIDNGTAGYSETGGGWSDAAGEGYGGSVRFNDAGTGTATARWDWTGLTAGNFYVVCLTWSANPNRATNTPYEVLDSDGTTVLASGTVNQEQAPNGFTDGVGTFSGLATAQPTGTTLSLRINDNANEFVIADAAGLVVGAASPPGAGDTATVNHNVTVDTTTAVVGTSPAEGNTVLTVNSGKTLTVAAGQQLTVKGGISCVGTLQVGEVGGGGTLEVDASGATDPTNQQYLIDMNGETGVFRTRGSSASHSAVRSNAGGGNAYTNGGIWDCQWCDFLRIGDATNPSLTTNVNNGPPATPTDWMAFADCTFTSCGVIKMGTGFPATSQWNFQRCVFSSSADPNDSMRLTGTTPLTGGASRVVNSCIFDKNLHFIEGSTAITNCVLDGGYSAPLSGLWSDGQFDGNFCFYSQASSGAFSLRGSVNDSYFLYDDDDNPHFPTPATTLGEGSFVVDGCVVEYGGSFLTDTGNAFYGGGTWTIQNTIILPAGGQNTVSSGAVTSQGVFVVTHCTLYSTGYSGGVLLGDGGSSVDNIQTLKSNLFWVRNSQADGVAVYDLGAVANTLNPNNTTHNGLVNIAATAYQGIYSGGTPGADDVRLDDTDETVVFLNPERSIATWAVSRGSSSVTYADRMADARSYLRADAALVSDLLTHVRNGFIVKHSSLRTAAHDGTVIGAVQDAAPAAVMSQPVLRRSRSKSLLRR